MRKDFMRLPKLILILIFYRLYPVAVIMLAVVRDRLFSQCSHFPPFIMKYVLTKTCDLIENRTGTCAAVVLLLRIILVTVNVSGEGKQHWCFSCGQTCYLLLNQLSKAW